MQLQLNNFKTHRFGSFSFPERGLVRLSGPSGAGKCLAPDTKVLMWNGSAKAVKDVKVGDILYGDDGTKRRVLSVTSGRDQMFEVGLPDGKYVCNGAHLLTLKRCGTGELEEVSVEQVLSWPLSKREKYLMFKRPYFATFRTETSRDLELEAAAGKLSKGVLSTLLRSSVLLRYEYLESLILALGGQLVPGTNIAVGEICKRIQKLCSSLGLYTFLHTARSSPKKARRLLYVGTDEVGNAFTMKPVGMGEYAGFQLDGNGRFLLADTYYVTHNSSILEAVPFALYGANKKPTTFGQDGCRVDITLPDGRAVTRTRKPNQLFLTEPGQVNTLKGEDAQKQIEQIYGEEGMFLASVYNRQSHDLSILLQPPAEQFRIVKRVALGGESHEKLKARIKERVRLTEQNFSESQTRLTSTAQNFASRQESFAASFPEEPEFVEGDATELAEWVKKWQSVEAPKLANSISRVKSEVNEAESVEKDSAALRVKIEGLGAQTSGLEISRLELEAAKKELSETIKRLSEATKRQNAEKTKREHEAKVADFEERKIAHLEHLRAQLQEVQEAQDPSELKSRMDALQNLTRALSSHAAELSRLRSLFASQVQTLKSKFSNPPGAKKWPAKPQEILAAAKLKLEECDLATQTFQIALESARRKLQSAELFCKALSCPSCEAKVRLEEGPTLVSWPEGELPELGLEESAREVSKAEGEYMATSVVSGEISKIAESMTSILEALSNLKTPESEKSLEELETELAQLSKDYPEKAANWKLRVQREKELKEAKLPAILERQRKEIENSKVSFEQALKILASLPEETDSSQVGALSQRKTELECAVKNLEVQVKKAETAKSQLTKLEKELKELETAWPKDEHARLKSQLAELNQKLEEGKETLAKHRALLPQLQLRQAYEKEKETLETFEKELRAKESEVTDQAESLRRAKRLWNLFEKAEFEAVEHFVLSLNAYAAPYLEALFEEPIEVALATEKEPARGAKNKAAVKRMNVRIRYEDHDYDSVSSLSAGERQRANLAFLLAMNELEARPFLFLDECLNNLDAAVNQRVLHLLQETVAREKLVVVVSHEAVEGVFDHVVSVRKNRDGQAE